MAHIAPDRLKIPEALWTGLARLNVDRLAVLDHAMLPRSLLRDASPMSTLQFFALWKAIESVSADAAVGLRMATALDGAVMPLSFMVAYHARDLRDALQRVARFKRLCAPEEMRLVEDGCGVLSMEWPFAAGAAPPPALVDATMASLMELARRGTRAQLRPAAHRTGKATQRAGDQRNS